MSTFDKMKDKRFKSDLVKAKNVYNRTQNTSRALAVFKYNPDSYIVRTNLSGRLVTNRNNLANMFRYLDRSDFVNANMIPR